MLPLSYSQNLWCTAVGYHTSLTHGGPRFQPGRNLLFFSLTKSFLFLHLAGYILDVCEQCALFQSLLDAEKRPLSVYLLLPKIKW